ncbi:MAG TPA: glycosyltransferase family 4 protein [Puia sp.]|nr:glycosyltransferase family 4 protein [Puia sp.]
MSIAEKPEIVFVLPDILGGVASLNKNIINNTSLRSQAYVKVILVRKDDWSHPSITDQFNADEVVHFRYGNHENIYAVLKRLNKTFGTKHGAIFCNEKLEMESICVYGTNKTVYQFIHDFYNIKLAVRFGKATNVYVTHTNLFKEVLQSADPEHIHAFCLPHGVNIPDNVAPQISSNHLKIVFAGRLVESKGVQDLFAIDAILKKAGVYVEWTIIGKGPMKESLEAQWKDSENIQFASPDTNEEVMALMSRHDIFILPSRFEGAPVTILEAMAAGIAPVVSDLPGGIREIVHEKAGRRVPVGDCGAFAETIMALHKNREMLLALRTHARQLAVEKFNIKITADNYFKLLLEFSSFKDDVHRISSTVDPIGFMLDRKWLPNPLVSFIRKLKDEIAPPSN